MDAAELKRLTIQVRKGTHVRGLRLPARDTAIVFTLSNGKTFEVDLHETPKGNILLRSHRGAIRLTNQDEGITVTIE